MKRFALIWLVAAIPLFLLISSTGRAFPLQNPFRRSREVSAVQPTHGPPATVRVAGGVLNLGADPHGTGEPGTPVTIRPFRMAAYETTFAQYDEFCVSTGRELPPDQGLGRGDRPVGCVSWYDAVVYCNWLSGQHGLEPCYDIRPELMDQMNVGGYDLLKWSVDVDLERSGYRLPTEAEWEYAARGGTESHGYRFSGSDVADEVAWYFDNSGRHPHTVGLKRPNELGVYDMSGNVFEWTTDWYAAGYRLCSELHDDATPVGAVTNKSIRGGSCFYDETGVSVIHRKTASPQCRLPYLGFRIVRSEYDS